MAPQEKTERPDVTQTFGEIVDTLSREGIPVAGIPLGGTIAMDRDSEGILVSRNEGSFTSESLASFNNEVIPYDPKTSTLDLEPATRPHSGVLLDRKLFSGKFQSEDLAPLSLREKLLFDLRTKLARWGGLESILDDQLPKGTYKREALAADRKAGILYSGELAHRLYTEDYPGGVQLDSSELYDSGPVLSAVIAGYILPRMWKESRTRPLSEMIFLLPVGTDRQREISALLDIIAWQTGATFITVGANSPFGAEGGDAEGNLRDLANVARAVHRRLLPAGAAYSIADGFVLHGILQKMDPSGRGRRSMVKGPDGRWWGGTFLANTAQRVSRLTSEPWPLRESQYKPEGFPLFEALDETNVVYTAICLARAFASVQVVNVNQIDTEPPLGVRIVVLEAAGEGNAPAQAVAAIRSIEGAIRSRTNRLVLPLFIITSEAVVPFVGTEYEASLVGKLEKGTLSDRVMSARGLPSLNSGLLAAGLLIKEIPKYDVIPHPLFRAAYSLEPSHLEKAMAIYGKLRGYHGFV
jgi:hypothetical protein